LIEASEGSRNQERNQPESEQKKLQRKATLNVGGGSNFSGSAMFTNH
jgi:hypothetical protein